MITHICKQKEIPLKQDRQNIYTTCPINYHEDDDTKPACQIYGTNIQFWYCHKCEKGGNTKSFIQHKFDLHESEIDEWYESILPKEQKTKHVIQLPHDIEEIITSIVTILNQTNRIFIHNNQLFYIYANSKVIPITIYSMLCLLNSYIKIQHNGKTIKISKELAGMVLDSHHLWNFPRIRSVETCPTITLKDKIIHTQGLIHNSLCIDDCPILIEKLTKEHAKQKLQSLAKLFDICENKISQSILLSAVFTAIVRNQINAFPLYSTSNLDIANLVSQLVCKNNAVKTNQNLPDYAVVISDMQNTKQASYCLDIHNGLYAKTVLNKPVIFSTQAKHLHIKARDTEFPFDYVKKHRGEIISTVISLIHSKLNSSFQSTYNTDWDILVRDVFLWLDYPDPFLINNNGY